MNPRFHVAMRSVQWSTFLQLAAQHKSTMYATAWSADYPDPDDFAQPFLASNGAYPKRNGFADPRLDQQIDGALLEQTCAHTLLDILPASVFEDDGFDPLQMEQMGENEPCRTRSYDSDLRTHGFSLPLRCVQN
jgi:hypothetical protein